MSDGCSHLFPLKIIVYYFRVKSVDWNHLLSTKFPEELTLHLKLFKQSRVRLKHIQLTSVKDLNGSSKQSPKKTDDKRTHRRNKSDTDLTWSPGISFSCIYTNSLSILGGLNNAIYQ